MNRTIQITTRNKINTPKLEGRPSCVNSAEKRLVNGVRIRLTRKLRTTGMNSCGYFLRVAKASPKVLKYDGGLAIRIEHPLDVYKVLGKANLMLIRSLYDEIIN